MRRSLVVCALLVCAAAAWGQESRSELYTGYAFVHADLSAGVGVPVASSLHGWDAAYSFNFNSYVALEGEGLGAYQSALNASAQDYAVVGGPRVNYRGMFLHGLFGFNHIRLSAGGMSLGQNSFAMVLGGGTEARLTDHFGVRTSVDYVLTRHNFATSGGLSQNNVKAGAGIVWFFGGRPGKSATRTSSAVPTAVASDSNVSLIPQLGLRGHSDERGFYITAVDPTSPLQDKGVTSDDILYSINDRRVHTAAESQTALPASGTVKVVILISRGAPVERTVEIK